MFSYWTCWQHSEEFCSSQLFKDVSEPVVNVSNIIGLVGRTCYIRDTDRLHMSNTSANSPASGCNVNISVKHSWSVASWAGSLLRNADVEGSQICTSYPEWADRAAKALRGRSVRNTQKHSEPTNYQLCVFLLVVLLREHHRITNDLQFVCFQKHLVTLGKQQTLSQGSSWCPGATPTQQNHIVSFGQDANRSFVLKLKMKPWKQFESVRQRYGAVTYPEWKRRHWSVSPK